MLSVLGRGTRSCDGVTRREALRVGGLGFTGLAWPDLFRARAAAAPAGQYAIGGVVARRCGLGGLEGAGGGRGGGGEGRVGVASPAGEDRGEAASDAVAADADLLPVDPERLRVRGAG